MMVDAKEVAERLAKRAESVCSHLLNGGKKIGHEWVYDPGHGKIKVELNGAKCGIWSHFGGEGGGDLLDLWARERTGGNMSDAFKEACQWLGIELEPFPEKKKQYKRPAKPEATRPATKGTQVDEYLRCERGLYPETLAAFKVMQADTMTGEKDGRKWSMPGPWVLFPYFRPERDEAGKPILSNIKWLHVQRDENGKKRTKQEGNAQPTLYGWQALDPTTRWVTIYEGEVDAMTGHQWGIPSLSLPQGAGTGAKQNWIDEDFDHLSRFDTIVLWMDMDEEGQKTIPELAQRLGVHRVRVVRNTPGKDANECYIKHAWTQREAMAAIDAATYLDPVELKRVRDFVDDVIAEFYPPSDEDQGIALPWPSAKWLRLRYGEVTMWTGLNSHGKTTCINQVLLHAGDQGHRSCVFSGEIASRKTLKKMVRQATQLERPSVAHIRSAMDWLDAFLWMVDRKGKLDREKLMELFRYARRRWGIRLFVIDSFMKIGIALDDYQAQSDFAEEITAFADAENCHVIVVAHPSKPKDETQPVGRLAIKGSGDLSDKAHNCVETWRNKPKEKALREVHKSTKLNHEDKVDKLADLHNKPDTLLLVDKQRETGREGAVELWFDPASETWADNAARTLPVMMTAPADPEQDAVAPF